jgi:uncharacterized membrane protein
MNPTESQQGSAPIPSSARPVSAPLSWDWLLLWGARGAASGAVLVSAYLAYAAWFGEGRVAGCGDDLTAACNDVLSSRWARWLGMPLGAWAILLYGSLLAATFFIERPVPAPRRRWAWIILVAGSLLATGGATWFIALQLLALRSWCSYCAAVHFCGFAVAGWVAWRIAPLLLSGEFKLSDLAKCSAAAGTAWVLMVLGQVLFNSAPGMRVVTIADLPNTTAVEGDSGTESVSPATAEDVPHQDPDLSGKLGSLRNPQHPWRHRRMTMMNGAMSLDAYDYPMLGDRDAVTPMVKLFDYTCDHCRELHAMLEVAEQKLGGELPMVLICVPMNTKCNPYASVNDEKHEKACELARLAIAVWQIRPEKFAGFHRWLMTGPQPPEPATAQSKAAQLVGADALQRALAEEAVAAQLAENCRLYSVVRDHARDGSIPKLIFPSAIASGLPSGQKQLELLLRAQGLTFQDD